MNKQTPPLSQLPSDCGNYVEGEIAEVTNPRQSSTEQKIMIAGSFDSDKIQMIRELIEEEAVRFTEYVDKNYFRVDKYKNNDLWQSNKELFSDNPITTKQLYQQSK